MGAALAIRHDLMAAELRRQVRRAPNCRAALRMLALANALDGCREPRPLVGRDGAPGLARRGGELQR